jgi:MerR family redox-sensitive transcriptional activator SoxR
MDELTIGEVARRAGLRPSAVRYYEHLGLLPAPRRVNGQRRYHEETVQALTIIQFAQGAGFSLAEIRRLWPQLGRKDLVSNCWPESAHEKLRQLDEEIEHIRRMQELLGRALNCHCQQLADCTILDRSWWSEVVSPAAPAGSPARSHSTNHSSAPKKTRQEDVL